MTENTTTFTVTCKNPQCIGGRMEVSIFGDSGYSNWTVMEGGEVSFKCHGCGKFASTEKWNKPNEPENFEVTCNKCGSHKWTENIQDVDGEAEDSNMECSGCHLKQFDYPTLVK